MLAALVLSLGFAVLGSVPARAGSRSALVLVTARVVESCRVEVDTTADHGSADLKMRCNSRTRPLIGLANRSYGTEPVGAVTLPRSELAVTPDGKTLSINF